MYCRESGSARTAAANSRNGLVRPFPARPESGVSPIRSLLRHLTGERSRLPAILLRFPDCRLFRCTGGEFGDSDADWETWTFEPLPAAKTIPRLGDAFLLVAAT